MKIYIDNNITLDALLGRQPFSLAAEKILVACADLHQGCLSVNSLTDIFYVIHKFTDAQSAKTHTKKLMELMEIISVNEEDCINALEFHIDDFEDALVIVCAQKARADYIVTRDEKMLLMKSTVPIISPEKLINIL